MGWIIFIIMNTNQPMHILNEMGVLQSFSVAKKITDEYIQKYFRKQKKSGRNKAEIQKMFIKKIENDIVNAMKSYQIPGLLKQEDLTSNIPADLKSNISDLNHLIISISHKVLNKKLNKTEMCYIINSIVNLLNLTEEDFEKFHGLNDENEEGDDSDGNENA